MELATDENTLLALEPISLIVPTTTAKITASMTAYSAMSCPSSPLNLLRTPIVFDPQQKEVSKGEGRNTLVIPLHYFGSPKTTFSDQADFLGNANDTRNNTKSSQSYLRNPAVSARFCNANLQT
jgi:hypothetical protein